MKRRVFLSGGAGTAGVALLGIPRGWAATSDALEMHPSSKSANPDEIAGWNVPHDVEVEIVRVTNLNTHGAGSLREALQRADIPESVYRVVVFDVSGRIDLGGHILRANQNRTIVAGQTAPGPIEIWGHTFQARQASEQLFMHLAFRGGKSVPGDSWQVDNVTKARFQNCSGANSVDEMMSFNNTVSDQVCLVDCLIGFQLFDTERGDHRFGPLVRNTNTRIGFYRNFFVGARRGMPRLENSCTVSFASNVFVSSGDNPAAKISSVPVVLEEKSEWPPTMAVDLFQNEYIWRNRRRLAQMDNDIGVVTTMYERDNFIRPTYSAIGQRIRSKPANGAVQVDTVQMPPGARLVQVDEALPFVLVHAGMRPAQRDSTDAMIVSEVVAEDIVTRYDAVDDPPPAIQRVFTPRLDWSQKDGQGRSNALVELDILHGELGGVTRWVH